ncbi:24013_t:CDS:1, partial [Cetraspora pellucida]
SETTSTSTSQANEHSATVAPKSPTITFQQPSETLSMVTSQLQPMTFETQQSASTTNHRFGDSETLTHRLDLTRQYVLNVIKR